MEITLLDERGEVLTDIASHVGRVPSVIIVDWATRPDALFRYYFDRGRRIVTAVIQGAAWSAVLGTRWRMGARSWFLHMTRRFTQADYTLDDDTCRRSVHGSKQASATADARTMLPNSGKGDSPP